MARNICADCRQCRREGQKLFLKGERCVSKKCAMERRPVPPGPHANARHKNSEYNTQLREKQKVKRAYGVLEKQFRSYYKIVHNPKRDDIDLSINEQLIVELYSK